MTTISLKIVKIAILYAQPVQAKRFVIPVFQVIT